MGGGSEHAIGVGRCRRHWLLAKNVDAILEQLASDVGVRSIRCRNNGRVYLAEELPMIADGHRHVMTPSYFCRAFRNRVGQGG